MTTADLLARARSGDGDAFRELTEPYRRELLAHCYRMLASAQDAEDVVQDTMLAAWQGLGSFQERASLRTWLYRIATNRCLNALRSASRRPAQEVPMHNDAAEPPRASEVTWLEPYPDFLLEGIPDRQPGPEARYEASEAISLAFITALQLLPPRQRADPVRCPRLRRSRRRWHARHHLRLGCQRPQARPRDHGPLLLIQRTASRPRRRDRPLSER